MEPVITILLTLCAIAGAIPALVFFIEILAGSTGLTKTPVTSAAPDDRIVLLIPAHDEEEGIAETARAARAEAGPAARILVVADNCSDQTASRAREAGAEVIERHDPSRRGKGFALDYGVRHLEGGPAPDVVIIFDADCRFEAGTVARLAGEVRRTGRPVQARYDMISSEADPASRRFAALAWLLKNHVRSRGRQRLGAPSQLTGTGMAFPWPVLRRAELATAEIVEDVMLGLELATAGHRPSYCETARVISSFARSERGFDSQRSRWERGSLRVVFVSAPRRLITALANGDVQLAALCFDLLVPPLLMLIFFLTSGLLISGGWGLLASSWLPVGIFGGALLLVLCAVLLGWSGSGRHLVRLSDFASVPAFLIRKIALYVTMFGNRGSGWVRTDRK